MNPEVNANPEVPAPQPLIAYEGVSVGHEGKTVLKEITFNVFPGDFVFLTGQVGSGKSSMLRTIYADLKPMGGKANVLGYDMTGMRRKNIPELRRQLGIVFQDCKLLGNLTVEENLVFVLRATGKHHHSEARRLAAEALQWVGLEGKGNNYPDQLSGGEQQRASIARAIVNRPKVILADEPTGNLDPQAAEAVTAMLKRLSEDGAAVIMSTHNMQLVEKNGGRVFRCHDGEFSELAADNNP